MDFDSDSSSSLSHSKRPSLSSVDLANLRASPVPSEDANHRGSPGISNAVHFRPTIKSSISQELFTGSDTESLDESMLERRGISPRLQKNLTEIEEESHGDPGSPARSISNGKRKEKGKAKAF